jgi:hypothetical protein
MNEQSVGMEQINLAWHMMLTLLKLCFFMPTAVFLQAAGH